MVWRYVLAVFLYLVAAILLAAEVFKPSGGIKSIIALACVIAGVAIFFKHSIVMGWIGIGIAVVMIPLVVIIAWRISFRKYRRG